MTIPQSVAPLALLVALVGSVETQGGDMRPDANWPAQPVEVSPAESVIESFWIPSLKATKRWTAEAGEGVSNVRLSQTWDGCFLRFSARQAPAKVAFNRPYDLAIEGYHRLVVRVCPGADIRTMVVATVDGREQTVVDNATGSNDPMEIAGPISGGKLNGLRLEFAAAKAGDYSIEFRWILLERPSRRWGSPAEPFKGMIVEQEVGKFEPGLGLIFDANDLQAMKRRYVWPVMAEVFKIDQAKAREQFCLDPTFAIRPFSLYAPARYSRAEDERTDMAQDGLLLALVGLMTENEQYMRQAARYGVVLALTGQWSEGFADRFMVPWTAAAFAPNVATIKASLLLDWTWNWLTPRGRELIRQAIREKGLKHLEGFEKAMTNQGVRFTKGLVLGRMAVAEDYHDARTRAAVGELIDKLNEKLKTVTRPDGTFSEGLGYGLGTMCSLPVTYVAASRCLGRPVGELVSPLMVKSAKFLLDAQGNVPPVLAAFCAGPLARNEFGPDCVPASLLSGMGGPQFRPTSMNAAEYMCFGMQTVWAEPVKAGEQVRYAPFSLYGDGGWVFMGNAAPALPRVSFESGLWDGHGHAWMHTNAVTLGGWGVDLLITRKFLAYSDARSRYTMSTRLYNTFAPSGRDQDASGTPGRGGKLLLARDFGPAVVAESDNATAWKSGVTRAVRRLVFLRPGVLVVHDVADLTDDEEGVQSWNSFQPWEIASPNSCRLTGEEAGVELTCLGEGRIRLTAGEDSVSREDNKAVPVYRAAFASAAAKRHRLLTVVAARGPQCPPPEVRVLDAAAMRVEIVQDGKSVRVEPTADGDGLIVSGEGELNFTLEDGKLLPAPAN